MINIRAAMIEDRRRVQARLMERERDRALERGRSVAVVSAKPEGGIHTCIIHPLRPAPE